MVWRQRLAPCFGTSGLRFGAEVLRHSLGRSYVTRACVVDRTVGACPITCSPRHLTSHLSHTYISTHSLHSHWVYFFLCDSRSVRLRAWGSEDNERVIVSRYTSRLGRPRLTVGYHLTPPTNVRIIMIQS